MQNDQNWELTDEDLMLIAATGAMTSEQCLEYLRGVGLDADKFLGMIHNTINGYEILPETASSQMPSRVDNLVAEVRRISADCEHAADGIRSPLKWRVRNMSDHESSGSPLHRVPMTIVQVEPDVTREIAPTVRTTIDLLVAAPKMTLSVRNLSRTIGRSERFIRSTLVERAGDVNPIYGLQLIDNANYITVFSLKHQHRRFANVPARRAIATYCAKTLIESGDIVILDGGDQTHRIAVALLGEIAARRLDRITIVTNNYLVLAEMTDDSLSQKDVIVLAVGGAVRPETASAHGPDAVNDIERCVRVARQQRPNAPIKAFVGVTLIGTGGCAVRGPVEYPTKEKIVSLTLEAAGYLYPVADSSKQTHEAGPHVFLGFSDFNDSVSLVTDAEPSESFRQQANIQVHHTPAAIRRRKDEANVVPLKKNK